LKPAEIIYDALNIPEEVQILFKSQYLKPVLTLHHNKNNHWDAISTITNFEN
jgi:hypothetical protein